MRKYLFIILLSLLFFAAYQYYRLPNVVDRVRSSVVYIQVQGVDGDRWSGSGVVVGDGLILTASHVIDDANMVTIISDDGGKIKSSEFFMSKDLNNVDLGLIVVSETNRPATLSWDDVEIGDTVFAVGSPYGLQNSLTVGVFSAYDRIVQDERLYQLDMSGNPGMSGCPVFNRYGSVIGILVRGAHCGIALVVPIEMCRVIVGVYESVQRTTNK